MALNLLNLIRMMAPGDLNPQSQTAAIFCRTSGPAEHLIGRGILAALDTSFVYYLNECELPTEPSERRGEPESFASEISNFKIYPNPTGGAITIECRLLEGQTAQMILTDLLGREKWTEKITCSGTRHFIGTLADGIYVCQVMIDGKVEFFDKIILLSEK